MSRGFIKLNRGTELLNYLAKERPTSIVLLLLIAVRAKWRTNHPDKSLEIGECYLGDFKSYGATRMSYRSDLANLKRTNQVTTRVTNKGTIARLVSSELFDINPENITTEVTNQLARQQPATNHPTNQRLTTNQEGKERKEGKNADDFLEDGVYRNVTRERLEGGLNDNQT